MITCRTRSNSLFSDSSWMLRTEPIPCHRCGNITPTGSIGLSLHQVSLLNRSCVGSVAGSRGESSLELEAMAAVQELSVGVESIFVSEMLPRTPDLIFVNVTTVEGHPYCLELTLKGWRITSVRLDCMIGDFTRLDMFTKYYDSLYALMNEISPNFQEKMEENIAHKLSMLRHDSESDIHSDESSDVSLPPSSPPKTNQFAPILA